MAYVAYFMILYLWAIKRGRENFIFFRLAANSCYSFKVLYIVYSYQLLQKWSVQAGTYESYQTCLLHFKNITHKSILGKNLLIKMTFLPPTLSFQGSKCGLSGFNWLKLVAGKSGLNWAQGGGIEDF